MTCSWALLSKLCVPALGVNQLFQIKPLQVITFVAHCTCISTLFQDSWLFLSWKLLEWVKNAADDWDLKDPENLKKIKLEITLIVHLYFHLLHPLSSPYGWAGQRRLSPHSPLVCRVVHLCVSDADLIEMTSSCNTMHCNTCNVPWNLLLIGAAEQHDSLTYLPQHVYCIASMLPRPF